MKARFVPAIRYIRRMVRLPDGAPVSLAEHQVNILDHVLTPRDGRLPYSTVVWSEPKKSGKTAIASWVCSWALNILGPRSEVLVVGNDKEQSQARVFAELVRVQQAHPTLKQRIVRATDSLLVLDDGSTCRAVALDAPGEAGPDPVLVCHDEAWGITSERARRLFDELTPPPTRPLACRWVSSYAGYSNESVTLEELYRRGLDGVPILNLPDSYANGSLFAFWSHTPRMPWQTESYYKDQQAELRPRAFLRLHRNQWVTVEGAFLDPAKLEAAIDKGVILRPPTSGIRYRFFADNSGGSADDMVLAGGHADEGRLVLDGVWDQAAKVPFDPTQTIARFAAIAKSYGASRIVGDTYGGKLFVSVYAKHGIAYEVCPLSPSQLYEAMEPGLNAGTVRLVNHARLIEQLGALIEKGNRIGHKYGGHDDYAIATAGCLYLLANATGRPLSEILAEISLGRPRDAAPLATRGTRPYDRAPWIAASRQRRESSDPRVAAYDAGRNTVGSDGSDNPDPWLT